MPLPQSPYALLAQAASLSGPIAHYLSARPGLREVAQRLIEQQWRERNLGSYPPLSLMLVTALAQEGFRREPLADALIRCYLSPTPLNLSEGLDYLAVETIPGLFERQPVDLHGLERLINECAPLLLDTYQQALTDFWTGEPDQPGPGQWLAEHLRQQLRTVCTQAREAGALDTLEAATGAMLAAFPDTQSRSQLANTRDVKVALLSLPTEDVTHMDSELLSAIVIERELQAPVRTIVLLFTVAGRVYRFDSMQALAQALKADRKGRADLRLTLCETPQSVFNAQADLLLDCQLACVRELGRHASADDQDPVEYLVNVVDKATSLIDISLINHWQALQALRPLLPAWLVGASEGDNALYVDGMIDLAEAQERSGGRSWLFELQSTLDHARAAVRDALQADFPGAIDLDLDDLQVINHQVTGVAIGSGGDLVPQGTIKVVNLSLAQFALSNLHALRAGSVELHSISGHTLPEGLTVDYLKALVQRLDIGKAFPELLQRRLLDDPLELPQRQRLFIDQLREQLPLQAIEHFLNGQGNLDKLSVQRIFSLCKRGFEHLTPVACRALAFIARPGGQVDVVRNAWLIEGQSTQFGPCVLYRPMHREPLRQFGSRAVLLEAIACEDALQADIVARLDERVRPVYAQGGFEQPHVQRFLMGDDAAPLSVPEPVRLDERDVEGPLFEQLYQGCAGELIARANAESVSNSEDRWLGYQELGWLMFNTVLPFLNGPLAVSAWMVQVFASLRQELAHPESEQGAQGLVGLLLNTAVVVLASRMKLERIEPVIESTAASAQVPVVRVPLESLPENPLDFSWSAGSGRLSEVQRNALQDLRSEVTVRQLGTPIPHGAWKGLYERDEALFVVLDGNVFAVQSGDEGVRIVGADARTGPWLQQDQAGFWRVDTRLKLRGGMPVNRRIQQMRAANQRRIEELEQQQDESLAERLRISLRLQQDIQAMGEQQPPSAQSLAIYGEHLREALEHREQAFEGLKALNQLKTQVDFRRNHGQYLFDQAANEVQLLFVLRQQFLVNRTMIQDLHVQGGFVELLNLVNDTASPEYQMLVERFDAAAAIVEDIIEHYGNALALRKTLLQTPPLGEQLIDRLDPLLAHEPPFKAWRSLQMGMLTVQIYTANRGAAGSHWMDSALHSIKLGLQMQVDLEKATGLSLGQQVEVLNSVSRKFAAAAEGTQTYREGAVEAQLPRLNRFQRILEELQDEVDAELAGRIRELASEAPAAASATSSHAVIHTRNKGVLLGERRQGEGGRPDEVVVTDAIDHTELGRFQESGEAGIWQATAPAAPVATASGTALRGLLNQSARALQEADRQLLRAQQQARTVSIPVEMEELLVNQAKPLEALAGQIEQALTRGNQTDTSAVGLDAALQARALGDKAAKLRAEGRRLRVGIIKRQPPTGARVEYLKSLGEVHIRKLEVRKPMRKRKGFAQDYLQEYEIADRDGGALWYAHLHYASLTAADGEFTAAHLKTVAQRFEGGQYRLSGERDNQKVIQVYRSQIDRKLAARLFFA